MPLTFDSYASVEDLTDQGLPDTVSEAEAQRLLLLASQMVEKYTRNFFREETGTFVLDGNNGYILHLPVPIISITSLFINNSSVELNTDYYRAYTGRIYPTDDRRNPKIELRRASDASSIFTVATTIERFLKGQDQTIIGTFGYLEPDNTVPAAIHEAVMILAIQHIAPLYLTYGGSLPGTAGTTGPVKKEKTDDHEKEWHNIVTGQQSDDGLWPPIVKALLKPYRAPRAIAVTDVRWTEY